MEDALIFFFIPTLWGAYALAMNDGQPKALEKMLEEKGLKLDAVVEHKSVELKAWEAAGYVTAEVRSHNGRIDKEAEERVEGDRPSARAF